MTLTTYLVYEMDTGRIIHFHTEPAGMGTKPEEIIQMLGLGRTQKLGVVTAPQGTKHGKFRVVDGELKATGDDAQDFGEASIDEGTGVNNFERRYEKVEGSS
jgi:hypothetical protein